MMMINRSGAGGLETVERPALRMRDGRPISGLLVHTHEGDVELSVDDLATAADLVSAANAMHAELKVAVEANHVTGSDSQ